CQTATVPAGTPLAVQVDDHLPMRVGQPIRAELIYPVYADNKLVLPEKTILEGTVTSLRADHSHRVTARLRADFTPFYIPVVRFTGILLDDGTTLPIVTGTATDGAPIYRLVPPPHRKGGFIHQQFDNGIQVLRDQLAFFTAPDKRDRFTQLLYTQLPYHPQRIQKGTAWTVETAASLNIPPQSAPEPALATKPADSSIWIVNAYLTDKLSSTSSKSGQIIHATVAEPIYNPDHTIAVPEGSTLVGAVTQAKPARRFGRVGVLHFDFRQLVLPSGKTQNVQTTVTSADSSSAQNLAMDSEGQVKPKPQDKVIVPLLLIALAASPLHQDRGDGDRELFRKNAGASNSIGLIGFIVGTASGSANVAAGFGAYGAALSLYNRWIKRGGEVTFARDTRIVVQTTARRSQVLKPNLPATSH
ncbi:MAG TPA: hypothetical protein VMU57_08325, partial [Edaphobacter sp.]|uniref:hypothetical protein n=1 Tax=Edaphobacter sp. TaxID=1934404 RepID=UPI002B5ABDC4